MDYIVNTLKNYLSRSTTYGILINGPWGSGKTHYFIEELVPIIDSIPISGSSNINYKTVYVSLYGVESIEEIQNKLLVEIFPILDNKVAKVSRALVDIAAKAFFKITKEDIDKSFHNALGNEDGGKLIDYKTLIICFDDFERRGKKLELSTILGYINSLVENKYKVIIIANEEKDTDAKELKEIKEKTIGITINFKQPFSNLFNKIVDNKFSTETEYLFFLKQNIETIEEYVLATDGNLRTMIYCLDCYLDIFRSISNGLKSETDEVKLKIYLILLKFSLAVAIEYRLGKITYKNLNELVPQDYAKIMNSLSNANIGRPNSNEPEKGHEMTNLRTSFIEKHYKNTEYQFFPAIFSYITTFNKGFLGEVYNEVSAKFSLNSPALPDHVLTYNKLLNESFELSDHDYEVYVKKMARYIKEGTFTNIIDYINSFNIIIRFDNSVAMNIGELENDTIEGAKKAKLTNWAISSFVVNDLMNFESSFSNSIRKITSFLVELSKEKEAVVNQAKAQELEKIFLAGSINDFYAYESENFKHNYYPYFQAFSAESVVDKIINNSVDFTVKFNSFLENRYKLTSKSFKNELHFFYKLRTLLLDSRVDKRKKTYIDYLVNGIQNIIKKIENSQDEYIY
jgi:hypothetical protein